MISNLLCGNIEIHILSLPPTEWLKNLQLFHAQALSALPRIHRIVFKVLVLVHIVYTQNLSLAVKHVWSKFQIAYIRFPSHRYRTPISKILQHIIANKHPNKKETLLCVNTCHQKVKK